MIYFFYNFDIFLEHRNQGSKGELCLLNLNPQLFTCEPAAVAKPAAKAAVAEPAAKPGRLPTTAKR